MSRELIRLSPPSIIGAGDTFVKDGTFRSQGSQLDKGQYKTRVGNDVFETGNNKFG